MLPLFGWLLIIVLAAGVPALRATTVIAPDFDRLVGSADYIVRARVMSMTPEWHENTGHPGQRYIRTQMTLEVLETMKGTPPSPLVLTLMGGRVGEDELKIEGAPRFSVGQESILFVKGNGRQIIPLVGMMHGCYPVRHDKTTGESCVMRSNGQPLYSEEEVTLSPSVLSPGPGRDRSTKPLTPTEFATRIRNARR